ncbi:MAG: bifunctional 4-hydroxy-2-oxoglutarate aldolase/2-dehydro-3-deoxy-phosphogluconate aldolase [Candidatus Nitrohelix vancouverensis]|uniref:Bifunctional 4-hydroxy-2-oxoglutarate aldolase/2-dehydro-3-deoxy-phosphogluconate aldolase n=1 Tax=Candidatus Nitrohelix vancouverensis TaxID=2705534 RepID=A0A7T0C5H3_9BACT|nr:MAG: bifunctional 4-hydroxy-2-oxoglutarate aldolase/2-dehydro-3-deoxy-phosphogluconate aldolase [Candidatus Nitrohelix vancouverensis]
MFDWKEFHALPVMGILRGVDEASLPGALEASERAGLRFIEITLNTANALQLIRSIDRRRFKSLCVGAGTVLSLQDADSAVNSGAAFLVSPTLNEQVAAFCQDRKIPYFPGALTPTEIERAWNAGASMIKVFPASQMGPDYFKMIKGPFQNIPLMAVGGVNFENSQRYLAAGASALALGGSIYSPERLRAKEFDKIENDIKAFLQPVSDFISR